MIKKSNINRHLSLKYKQLSLVMTSSFLASITTRSAQLPELVDISLQSGRFSATSTECFIHGEV